MDNIQNLPKHQQSQLEQYLVNSQVKDSLCMYMDLVERCFDTCVSNFRSKHMDKYEVSCTENCSERYIKLANRAGIRFQEYQAMQVKKLQESNHPK